MHQNIGCCTSTTLQHCQDAQPFLYLSLSAVHTLLGHSCKNAPVKQQQSVTAKGCAGLHRGSAEKLPDGAVCVTLEWDDPLGGIGTDVFYTPAPGLLYVDSTLLMQGQVNKYRTIYKKQ